jgi:GNAT superfamily N-acetyltransferase
VLNQLVVDAPTAADELVSVLDELYADLTHRRAFLERAEVGDRLAPFFKDAGWLVERDVFMMLRRDRDRPAQPGLAREADERAVRAVEAQTIAEQRYGDATVVEELLASRAAFARAGRARYFVAGRDGVDASHASLYSDRVVAQVEDVGTVAAARGHGLARAACSAAIDAALSAGHEFVFIVADADDWPKDLYTKLGFDPVGHAWSFSRPDPDYPVTS